MFSVEQHYVNSPSADPHLVFTKHIHLIIYGGNGNPVWDGAYRHSFGIGRPSSATGVSLVGPDHRQDTRIYQPCCRTAQ